MLNQNTMMSLEIENLTKRMAEQTDQWSRERTKVRNQRMMQKAELLEMNASILKTSICKQHGMIERSIMK